MQGPVSNFQAEEFSLQRLGGLMIVFMLWIFILKRRDPDIETTATLFVLGDLPQSTQLSCPNPITESNDVPRVKLEFVRIISQLLFCSATWSN